MRLLAISIGLTLAQFFLWSDEEGEIFWDTYNDMIKFGIPIAKRDDYATIKNKISRAIEQKIN